MNFRKSSTGRKVLRKREQGSVGQLTASGRSFSSWNAQRAASPRAQNGTAAWGELICKADLQ